MATQDAWRQISPNKEFSRQWSLVQILLQSHFTLRLEKPFTVSVELHLFPKERYAALKRFLRILQDEDEFPDLAAGGSVLRNNKPEPAPAQTHTQPKLPKNLVRERSCENPLGFQLCVGYT